MHERSFVEQISWDIDTIVDVAYEVSVEILKVEGALTPDIKFTIARELRRFRQPMFDPLTFVDPVAEAPLITFVPPLDLAMNEYDLDEGERSAEAFISVHNPYPPQERNTASSLQLENILGVRLVEVSRAYNLMPMRTRLTAIFPKENFAKESVFYNLPVL